LAEINLGIVLAELLHFEEAAAAFHRALELEPDNVAAQNNLGNVLRYQGQLDEAVGHFSMRSN